MNNNLAIDIAKKEIEKAIINELCKKGLVDFSGSNTIIKRLDEDILKLENKFEKTKDMKNIVIKILI